MKKLIDNDFEPVRPFFEQAAKFAQRATCRKARCGSVVVADGKVIGTGYNSPLLDKEEHRRCGVAYDSSKKPRYGRTCCVHAEWRAILDASKSHPGEIEGSTIYFMRIDDAGGFTPAGDPFCTVCSRLAAEAGIARFALWNEDGAYIYDAEEYDKESYGFFEQPA
jgi:deoxycytidylate deaminase